MTNWLNANRIALNVTKTEVILFKSSRKAINYTLKIKLCGKRLYLKKQVKYLGIILDEHLSWKSYLNSLATKLRKANGIISRLRHCVPQKTMITIYNALFHSHIIYAIQIWGQNLNPTARVIKLQKTAVRLITFSEFNAHSKPLFKLLKIQSIIDTTFILNIKLVHQTLNYYSPTSIQKTLNLTYLLDTYLTRAKSYNILKRHKVKTTSFGINSIRYQSTLHWNTLQVYFKEINLLSQSFSKIKAYTIKYLSTKC